MSWTTKPPLTDGWSEDPAIGLGEMKYSELGMLTYEDSGLNYESTGFWGREPAVVAPWD